MIPLVFIILKLTNYAEAVQVLSKQFVKMLICVTLPMNIYHCPTMPCLLLVSALDLVKCPLFKSLGKVIQNVQRCLVKSLIVLKIDLKNILVTMCSSPLC